MKDEKAKKFDREWRYKKYHSDPEYRMKCVERSRLHREKYPEKHRASVRHYYATHPWYRERRKFNLQKLTSEKQERQVLKIIKEKRLSRHRWYRQSGRKLDRNSVGCSAW